MNEMKSFTLLRLLGTFVVACLLFVPGRGVAQTTNSPKTFATNIPFASEINAFLKRDTTNRPAEGIIEFVGSSTIRLWTSVAEDMAPLPVFNRGFGGSKTTDLLFYMDDVIIAYKPRVIVLYCGTNDFDSKSKDGKDTADRTIRFFEQVAARLPETKIVYISIVRSPLRKAYWGCMTDANERIQKYCVTHSNLTYVDVNPALLGENGEPRSEFFQNDRLHFTKAGYRQITPVVKPAVEAAFKK
jgi:lysophospholipase L1-like esterase